MTTATPNAAHTAPLTTSTRLALAGALLCTLLGSLSTSIANVALPTLAARFDAPFQSTQWVVIAYLLAITTVVVIAGRMGDLWGRRRVLQVGLAVFMAGSVLCSLATGLDFLIAARALQGFGAALLLSLSMAIIGDLAAKAGAGAAIGLLGTVSAVGTALGPTLGGLLISTLGWPAIFLLNVPLGLLALYLVVRHVPKEVWPDAGASRSFDLAGAAVLAATLTSYALSVTVGRGSFGAINAALLAGAVTGLALFIAIQHRAAAPLLRLAVFRNPDIAAGLAMSVLVTTVIMATLVVGPFHLSRALMMDAHYVGLAMSVGPVVSALTGAPAGRAVDRYGAARITFAGLALMSLGCAGLALMPLQAGIAGYLAPLAFITAGYALFQASNNTAVMANAAKNERGVVSGLLNLSRNLGLVTGASVMGALFAFATGPGGALSGPAESVAEGTRVTFLVGAGLGLVALGIAYFSKRPDPRRP